MLRRLLTRNYTFVPLFWVSFNLKKFRKYGAKGSCDLHIHPCLAKDKYIRTMMEILVDYIRENYDMEDIV